MGTTLQLDTTTDDIGAAGARRFRQNDYRIVGETAYLALTRRDGSLAAEVMINASDLPAALGYGRWTLHEIKKASGTVYRYARHQVMIGGERVITYLHRLLLDAPDGMHVDHISGQTLDCRRCNMRVVTPKANGQNASAFNPHNPTGLRNVRYVGGRMPYMVVIVLDGIEHRVGRYQCLQDAAAAAARARVELHPYYDPRRDEALAAWLSQPVRSRTTSLDDMRIALDELQEAA